MQPLYVCSIEGCDQLRYQTKRQRTRRCHEHQREQWRIEARMRRAETRDIRMGYEELMQEMEQLTIEMARGT